MPIYPFVSNPNARPDGCSLSVIHERLEAGERLHEVDTRILMDRLDSSSVPKGCAAQAGWCFDFRPLLNLYWVQWYDSIISVYAPNKKAIRKHLHGRIWRIVLVEKRGIRAHK
jgi:hypothetical protein